MLMSHDVVLECWHHETPDLGQFAGILYKSLMSKNQVLQKPVSLASTFGRWSISGSDAAVHLSGL